MGKRLEKQHVWLMDSDVWNQFIFYFFQFYNAFLKFLTFFSLVIHIVLTFNANELPKKMIHCYEDEYELSLPFFLFIRLNKYDCVYRCETYELKY